MDTRSFGITGQWTVWAEHGDGVRARHAIGGKDGQPITVFVQAVAHGDGAGVAIHDLGRVAARDAQMDLVPPAVVGSQ